MSDSLDSKALDTLFRTARTHNGWQDKPVPASLLRDVWDLAQWPPTAANSLPMRVVFVTSSEGKAKLKPTLAPGNVEKSMQAPVIAIIAHDTKFYEFLPRTFPQVDAKSWYEGNDALIAETAFRNGSLQGAYLILAARALGLDAGPMSGFDNQTLDAAFFPDGRWKSNFLVNLGYGDASKLYPRNPRLSFEEGALII